MVANKLLVFIATFQLEVSLNPSPVLLQYVLFSWGASQSCVSVTFRARWTGISLGLHARDAVDAWQFSMLGRADNKISSTIFR
jgi:hypothetical protein